jgi:PAS domain S-box-containing protein
MPGLRKAILALSALVFPCLATIPSGLDEDLGKAAPALLYLAAVLGSTYVSGIWAGLAATLVSALAYIWFYLPPNHTWAVSGAPQIAALLSLVMVSVFGAVVVDRLLRARREVGRALEGSDLRYRSLVDQLPAVITVDEIIGDDVRPVFISDMGERMFGFSSEEWLRDPQLWRRYAHPDDVERVMAEYKAGLERSEPFAIEYRMVRANGEITWVLEHTRRIVDPSGRVFAQSVAFDVSDMKTVQGKLEESIDDLRRTDAERRFLLARLVHAQEEERSRIASDLHDDPVQKMTAVGLRLEALATQATPEQKDALREIEGLVVSTVDRMRRLMFDLRPIALDRLGLDESLSQFLAGEMEEAGTEWNVESKLVSQPPPQTRVIVYRIAQEALQNVRKHAGARHLSVVLTASDGGVLVRIRDDGKGFRIEEGLAPRRGHLGLLAMQERAELAGGWFAIRSEEGIGTTVEFWVPPVSGAFVDDVVDQGAVSGGATA